MQLLYPGVDSPFLLAVILQLLKEQACAYYTYIFLTACAHIGYLNGCASYIEPHVED